MVTRRSLNPVVCAAAGTAAGFYCLGALFRSGALGINALFLLLLLPLALLCFFRVTASFPVEGTRAMRLAARYAAAFAAGVVLGLGAAGAVKNNISWGIPADSVKAVSGVLTEDPRIVGGGRAMAAVSLRETHGSGGLKAGAKGEITVFFPEDNALRLRDFGRGTVVFAEGTIRQGRAGAFFSAESAHVLKPAPALERLRTGIRGGLIQRFTRLEKSGGAPNGEADAAWGGLALALLLGIRDNLDSALSGLYRDAGCSYELALSGMHLAVLAAIIAFLLKRPLGLKGAAIAGACIIALYCFLVGPLPSLNRAALMYLLGTLAILGALPRDGLSILCLSFVIQTAVSPGAGSSLSFILSYLALAGILTIGESLADLGRGKAPSFILQPLCASLGAFLATAGVCAFFFGILRPAGLVTGLVLVPLTTVFMIGGLGALALDLISPVLSGFLTMPLSLLYRLMEKTVFIGSRLPGITASHPLVILVLSLVLSLALMWFAYRRRLAKNRLPAFA
jgi:competence protein ComEC